MNMIGTKLLTNEGVADIVQKGLKENLPLETIIRYFQVRAGSEFLGQLYASRLGDSFPDILTVAEDYQLEVAAMMTEINAITANWQ